MHKCAKIGEVSYGQNAVLEVQFTSNIDLVDDVIFMKVTIELKKSECCVWCKVW